MNIKYLCTSVKTYSTNLSLKQATKITYFTPVFSVVWPDYSNGPTTNQYFICVYI